MASAAAALLLSFALGIAPGSAPAEPTPVVPEPDAAPTAPEQPEPDDSAPPTEPGQAPPPASPDSPALAPTGSPTPGEPAAPTDHDDDDGASASAEPIEPAAPTGDGDDASDDDPFGDEADAEPWPDDPPPGDEPGADDDEPLPDYDPLLDSPQALRARHWVRTGIGTAAAGGALLIGAIIIGASDPCNRAAGNSCQMEARNRAALVMGIPAAVLIGGGATMLGLGLARQRALVVDLQASRQGLGVGVRGRF